MTLDPDPLRAEGTDDWYDDYDATRSPWVRHLIAFLLGALTVLGLVVVFGARP